VSTPPRHDAAHDERPPGATTPALVAPHLAARVLLVEPDAVLRGFLARLLERHGLTVLLATSVEEGARVLARSDARVGVVVHDTRLLASDAGPLAAQFGRGDVARRVIRYGGDAVTRRGAAPMPRPLDGDALAREVLAAAVMLPPGGGVTPP
jgi:CheY-like chemotaxis protein